MVTQVREPAALDLKTLPVIVLSVSGVTQRLRVDNSAPLYRSIAEKDGAESRDVSACHRGLGEYLK
jgi:hypothetical protein